MTDVEKQEVKAPATIAWEYAPSQEARDIVSIEERYGLFIGGEQVEPRTGEWFPTVSPSTEEPLAEVAQAGPEDVDAAVGAARAAFEDGWSALRPSERAKYLFRLARILQEEEVWADQANALRERHEAQRRWVLYLLVGVPVAMVLLIALARWRDRVPGVPEVLEQPPEPDPVQGALLWSAWQGHLSARNAYRAQLLHLADLGAIELRAEGRVTDPKDLTVVRKLDALSNFSGPRPPRALSSTTGRRASIAERSEGFSGSPYKSLASSLPTGVTR